MFLISLSLLFNSPDSSKIIKVSKLSDNQYGFKSFIIRTDGCYENVKKDKAELVYEGTHRWIKFSNDSVCKIVDIIEFN